jgi:hypothetical protein
MSLPKVSVVTSSWMRPRTVVRHAVASVLRQDYGGDIEHLVVIDGDDQATVDRLLTQGYNFGLGDFRIVQLGRNWSDYSKDGGFGATARLVGSWMASGDLIAYLDDDNDYATPHVREMVNMFDGDTDFVTNGPGAPPGVGRTDTSGIMHRAMVLKTHGGFQLDGYEGDGHMVERWVAGGLKWKNKPNPTFTLTTGYHHGAHLG